MIFSPSSSMAGELTLSSMSVIDAGGVGLEGEPGQVVHELDLFHVLARGWRGRAGRGTLTTGLGLRSHSRGHLQPVLEVADAGEVLVEAVAVARRRRRAAGPAPGRPRRRGCSGRVELADLRFDFCLACPARNSCRKTSEAFSSQGISDAGAGPGEAALALLDVDAEGERGEAGQVADPLGDVLVERDGVAEAAAARVRGGGEEAVVGGVAAVDVGVRDAAEDGEVVAVVLRGSRGRARARSRGRRPWGRTGRAAGPGCCRWRASGAACRRAVRRRGERR